MPVKPKSIAIIIDYNGLNDQARVYLLLVLTTKLLDKFGSDLKGHIEISKYYLICTRSRNLVELEDKVFLLGWLVLDSSSQYFSNLMSVLLFLLGGSFHLKLIFFAFFYTLSLLGSGLYIDLQHFFFLFSM